MALKFSTPAEFGSAFAAGVVVGGDGTATIQDFGEVRVLLGDEDERAKRRSPEETVFRGEPEHIRDAELDCPKALENLILRCLKRRRELRPQNVEAGGADVLVARAAASPKWSHR
jgi:hypothetical protein